MAVPEQIPYIGYLGNGTSTEFPITFDLNDQGYLVVTQNKEIPAVGAYTVDMSAMKVVFATAPKQDDQIELYRDTQLNRDTNYKSYDNSFRPETVNWDFDKIIHILQEQNMIDAQLAARLKQEIEWRRTHDANFDELAKMRDAQVFSGLKQYLDTIIASTDPNIFGGVTAGIVFALDKKSVQTHLENIYQEFIISNQKIEEEKSRAEEVEQELGILISTQQSDLDSEVQRAIAAEAVIDAKFNANGVGNRAYKTYAEMDTDKANIPAKSKVTVTNDITSSNNGDWQWDGTTFTKSIYDPISQAAADATAKANAAETNAKTHSDAKVELSQAISQYLVSKSADTTAPKFGDVTLATPTTNVFAGTYILANAATTNTTIRRFSIISGVASGNIELRLYTRSGDTFTMKKSIANLTVSKIGLNQYGLNDFLPFAVAAGDYVACVVKTNSAMVYSGSSVNDVYFSNTNTGTNPIVGTAGKFNLKFAFFDTTGAERAQAFIDYLEQASNESDVTFDNILTSYTSNKGLTASPSAKSGVNNGAGHMCIGVPISGFGNVSLLEVYSATTGLAQVGVYTRSGTAFTRKRHVDVNLVAGLNTIQVNLAVGDGEYVGLRTTVVGQVEYENNSTGHEGMYVSTGAITDDSFNVSSTTPIGTFAYQLRFGLTCKMLSNKAFDKIWLNKKYTSFGDSITWYNGRAFASTHLESGQIAKGYQSYVVDELGCDLDNRGQSGWDMTQIYASQIATYDFTGVYLTTITSGANDCRKGVPVGTLQAIGSTFNTNTYAGAMQAAIEKVIASNKATKIVLITPIRGWYSEYNTTDVPNTDPTVVGLMKAEYPDMVKAIGKLYGIPVVDFYYGLGWNDLNKNYYLGDNPDVFTAYLLHPMNRGFQRMGEILLATLRNL